MEANFDLVGGALALDLVNTGMKRTEGPFGDLLPAYPDIARWAVQAGVLLPEDRPELEALAEREPAAAARVLEKTRALREAIYRVFSPRHAADARRAADLQMLTRAYTEAVAQQELLETDDGIAFGWKEPLRLELPYWAAALSAVDLLQSNQLNRVKECEM